MNAHKLLSGSVMIFLAVSGLLTGCDHKDQPLPTDLTRVTVSKPEVREIRDWETFTGQVKAKEEAKIRAQVTGYVEAVKFTEGTEVKAGQVLFEIDPSIYDAALKQAKGQLELRKADKFKADENFKRSELLQKKNGISQQEYDESLAAKKKAVGAVLAAEGDVEQAATNLKFCTIKAPITGQVGKALVTKGNLINQAGATIMTTIVEMEPIYAEFGVDERALLQYKEAKFKELKGTKVDSIKDLKIPVELGLSVQQGFPHKGFLEFADNKVDPNSGTILVRAEFPNASQKLLPGLFAKVRIATSDPYQALLVNDRALLTDQSEKYLLVAVKDQGDKYKVKRKDVEIGELTGDGLRVIKLGLAADDLVIVNGVQYARPESLVEATTEKMPTLPGKAPK